MVGARREPDEVRYPAAEIARRYGAGVERETADPKEAYAPFARGGSAHRQRRAETSRRNVSDPARSLTDLASVNHPPPSPRRRSR
jgi:hypothetical protein